jgi:hypothetical protein
MPSDIAGFEYQETQRTHEVISNVQGYRSDLYAQKRQCADELENSKIKTKNAWIAAIVSGGLIYLANKKQWNKLVQEDLVAVNVQLSRLGVTVIYSGLHPAEHLLPCLGSILKICCCSAGKAADVSYSARGRTVKT